MERWMADLMFWPNGEPPRKKRAHWDGGPGGYAAEPGD